MCVQRACTWRNDKLSKRTCARELLLSQGKTRNGMEFKIEEKKKNVFDRGFDVATMIWIRVLLVHLIASVTLFQSLFLSSQEVLNGNSFRFLKLKSMSCRGCSYAHEKIIWLIFRLSSRFASGSILNSSPAINEPNAISPYASDGTPMLMGKHGATFRFASGWAGTWAGVWAWTLLPFDPSRS